MCLNGVSANTHQRPIEKADEQDDPAELPSSVFQMASQSRQPADHCRYALTLADLLDTAHG